MCQPHGLKVANYESGRRRGTISWSTHVSRKKLSLRTQKQSICLNSSLHISARTGHSLLVRGEKGKSGCGDLQLFTHRNYPRVSLSSRENIRSSTQLQTTADSSFNDHLDLLRSIPRRSQGYRIFFQPSQFRTTDKMCYVVRIKNRCGHINDHVQMRCRVGKPISPLSSTAALQGLTNRATAVSRESHYIDSSKIVTQTSSSTNSGYGVLKRRPSACQYYHR